MSIETAQYITDENGNTDTVIKITDTNGVITFCHVNQSSRHYAEIMRQVEAGTLVIQPAATQQETDN